MVTSTDVVSNTLYMLIKLWKFFNILYIVYLIERKKYTGRQWQYLNRFIFPNLLVTLIIKRRTYVPNPNVIHWYHTLYTRLIAADVLQVAQIDLRSCVSGAGGWAKEGLNGRYFSKHASIKCIFIPPDFHTFNNCCTII